MPTGRRSKPASPRRAAQGAERIVLLGDYVGYGADPEWTVTTVMDLVDNGATAVRGNHDNAVGERERRLSTSRRRSPSNGPAASSVRAERRFLAELPVTREEDDRLYVHADATRPASWIYVVDVADAARSIAATAMNALVLRPHPSAGALFDVARREDDGVHADRRRRDPAAAGAALARGAGIGRPAARWQSGGHLRHVRTSCPRLTCRAPYDLEAAAARIRDRACAEAR